MHKCIPAVPLCHRDEVEAHTDKGAAPPFGALDEAERAAFLRGLEALPD